MKKFNLIIHGREFLFQYYSKDRYLAIFINDIVEGGFMQIDETVVIPPIEDVVNYIIDMVSENDRVCKGSGCTLHWWFICGGFQVCNNGSGVKVSDYGFFDDRMYLRLLWDRMIKSETTEVFGSEKLEVLGHVPEGVGDGFRVFRLGFGYDYNYIAVPPFEDYK